MRGVQGEVHTKGTARVLETDPTVLATAVRTHTTRPAARILHETLGAEAYVLTAEASGLAPGGWMACPQAQHAAAQAQQG